MSKYNYYKVIQGNYGYGWDDVDFHECNSTGWPKDYKTLKENVRAYRENEYDIPHRIVFRRELKENTP